jgi:hypothetical protein
MIAERAMPLPGRPSIYVLCALMAESRDEKDRRRSWEVPVTVQVALIGAVAVLGAAFWTSHATQHAQDSAQRAALDQQRLSFGQQRALADREALRNILDEAAATLDKVITEIDQMAIVWDKGQPGHPPSSDEFDAALEDWNAMILRLGLRFDPTSDVLENFKAAGVAADDLRHNIVRFPLTRSRFIKSQRDLQRAIDLQNAFTDAARQVLNP